MLNRFFQLDANRTTLGRELQAGLTTFAAMAYILAVNPAILSATGMDKPALVTVTAITAALATTIMALLTNYPIALAPGMGINAFFTYTICLAKGVPWPEALGMVFVNGVIFLVLSVTGVREKIIAAIPHALKIAVTCGIGLFIAFIGLKNGGVIVANPATFVSHGDFAAPPVALCLGGIVLTAILVSRRVPGAIVLSIAIITLAGLLVPDGQGGAVTRWPADLVTAPASPAPVLLKLSFNFLASTDALLVALPLILTLLLVDMFDNIGTLIGVTKRAGFLRPDGTLPKAGRALIADSVATLLSALAGTSTVVSYIESASGVEAGGRTGLTTLTTAALMLLALFFTPLILMVPAVATAPALVIVGVFMMQSVTEIEMRDFAIAAPAVLTILAIPFTFSIAEGIGLGLIVAAVLALTTGQPKNMTPVGYAVAAVFFLQFFRIWPFGG
ncbi:NCS2 family permease [Opitutus terrae]|uniref:Xanthine/uracil/vitamin C permease n=1 Tax=Opitutus terrae (strain DSM 11246 / JCM 15787 / PB90-1) TaxID=452637 RepID=B1ZWA8_OPITP|nr:NCS2 family permease [Opitutus terrae]ACB76860.1 Xanthine/uracil/vitamin C permease [Opitutus terrae PB90-1]